MASTSSEIPATSSDNGDDQMALFPNRLLHGNPKMLNPSNEPGKKVASWLNSLFTVLVALSTLGASVTFSYVVSGIRTPTTTKSGFSNGEYETFMALSWLLFILDLAFATLFSTLLAFYQDQAVAHWQSTNKVARSYIQWSATAATALLYGMTIAAFIFLSLVITAYSLVVGWIAVGFTVLFGLGGFIAIAVQSPAFRKAK